MQHCRRHDDDRRRSERWLPGFGAERERSAALLAEQGTPVPVFMKSETNRWRYVGNYRVTRRSTEAAKA